MNPDIHSATVTMIPLLSAYKDMPLARGAPQFDIQPTALAIAANMACEGVV